MTPQERFRKAKELFYQALEIEVEARPQFVKQACCDDVALINEVNALLVEEREQIFTQAIRNKLAQQADHTLSIASQQSHIGQILKHRYTITERFHEGGMSVLYLAYDKFQPAEPVLIKILKEQANPDVQKWLIKHFASQAKALARIRHPAIVESKDFGFTPSGQPFLAMEKIFGADLRSQIVAGKGLKGGWTRVAAIIRQIGAAISAAHDCGIYHRDLKPENIMLQSSPTSASQEQVKIIDFDIATVKDSYDEKTRTTLFIAGSFNYAAPEQLEQKPGRASDIYALAIIVYEMLTGKLPFASLNKLSGNQFEQLIEQVRVRKQGEIKRLRELNPLAPRIVEDLLLQALAYEPSLRPSRADRFMNMLADALLNSTDTAPTNIVEKNIGKANNQALAKKSQKVYLPIIIILTIFTLAGTFGWRALPARQSQFRSPDNAIAPPATLDCQLIYSLSLREMQSPDHYRDKVILAGEEIVFHTGDLIKLNIASTSDGYLYIISESPVTEHEKPKYRLLFPDAQESNLLMAGQQQTIPAGNDPGFQFTGAKGTEKIWLIYARQQQPELESLRELVNSSEMGAINSPQQVGELQLLLNGQNSVRPMRDEKRNLMVAQGQGRLILALLRLTHN